MENCLETRRQKVAAVSLAKGDRASWDANIDNLSQEDVPVVVEGANNGSLQFSPLTAPPPHMNTASWVDVCRSGATGLS